MIKHNSSEQQFAISASNLVKTYRSGWFSQKQFHALGGVTFDVPKGSIFGLLGPNGAGKTTFVKTLLGVIKKTSGDASIFGYGPGSREAKKRIGYLPERLTIPNYLTGYQALSFYGGLSNLSGSEIRAKRDGLLDQVGLNGWGNSPVSKYSKGMVQRLGLAQALCADPDLLILDEPTDGLDPEARAGVREILKNLCDKGVTIFLNSHLLQEVELVCQKVAILAEGTLRYCGDVDQVDAFLRKDDSSKDSFSTKISLDLPSEKIPSADLPPSMKPLEQSSNDKEEGITNFKESFEDFGALNHRIDSLRKKDITIVSVVPQRISLEEAFLRLVKSDSSGESSGKGGLTQAGQRN